jgi:hypothetical protein
VSIPADGLQLPAGGVLLHIGPFKTGTTAIQGALQGARDRLPEHGALYPGTARRAARPGWAVLGRKQRGRDPVPIEEWEELAAEVRAASDLRVCVSTEDFGSASPRQVERIVADLGGERVHVVAVARRLDKLLPSQWQERVKSHDRISYHDWLRAVLGTDEAHFSYRNFWASHDLVRTFDRWAPTVGRDRFQLVVSEEGQHELLPRLFERMLALPEGLLQLAPYRNQSLTMNGTELVRRLNEVFEDRRWPDELYFPMLQRGLMQALIEAPVPPHEDRIPPLPTWAAERVAELTERRAQQLAERGVRVVGDLEHLRPEPGTDTESENPDRLAVESAALAVTGAVEGACKYRNQRQRARQRELRQLRQQPPSGPQPEPSGRELLAELAHRVRRSVTRRSGPRPTT